jgi:hypothetical protein
MAEPRAIGPGKGRLVFGCVLLALSIVPWVVAPFTTLIGLPAGQLASVIAALLIGAEVIGAIAVAVLGREAYVRITGRLRRSNKETPQVPTFRTSETEEKVAPDG